MAVEILRFSPGKESSVTRMGMNVASELLEALGHLAMAQERGSSLEFNCRPGSKCGRCRPTNERVLGHRLSGLIRSRIAHSPAGIIAVRF